MQKYEDAEVAGTLLDRMGVGAWGFMYFTDLDGLEMDGTKRYVLYCKQGRNYYPTEDEEYEFDKNTTVYGIFCQVTTSKGEIKQQVGALGTFPMTVEKGNRLVIVFTKEKQNA